MAVTCGGARKCSSGKITNRGGSTALSHLPAGHGLRGSRSRPASLTCVIASGRHGMIVNRVLASALPDLAPSGEPAVVARPLVGVQGRRAPGVRFQKSGDPWRAAVSCCPFVLVDQTAQNWLTLDAFVGEARDGVGRLGRLGWAKITGTVRPSTVVVANVFPEHYPQMPLTEDQHTVGEFGSDSADEPFGETIRSRATTRNPDHLDAHIGQDSIERRGKLAGPIADEEAEFSDAIAEIHHQVADLLGSPSAIGIDGHAQQMHGAGGNLQDEQHVDPLECHRAVHMEEVTGQHRRCLRAQELPPGHVGVADRCRRDP